jgi:hypothetical protein
MVRSAVKPRVSNKEAEIPRGLILRDAAARPLRMRVAI